MLTTVQRTFCDACWKRCRWLYKLNRLRVDRIKVHCCPTNNPDANIEFEEYKVFE